MAYKDGLGIIQCGTIKIPVSNPDFYRGTEIEMWHGQVILRVEGHESQAAFKACYAKSLNFKWDSIHVGGAEDSQEVIVFTTYIGSSVVKDDLLPKLRDYFLSKSSVKIQVQAMLPEGWDYERVDKWIVL